jgi:hypothetical protein
VVFALAVAATAFAATASADTVGPITFEPSQGYVPGDIGGQQGWQKLNPAFDVKVATVATYPDASGYGFGTQALRLSDAYTSGSFGDQTFSPPLLSPAGEGAAKHFEAFFLIGSTKAAEQTGMHVSVSPDDGNGARMSYLRFEDQSDGIHAFFDDVQQPGPCGPTPGCANFVETEIATLSRSRPHSIRFSMDFKNGPGNDVVRIYIDGRKKITGTSWEDYYRYDPEAAAHLGQPPKVSRLLFRESGTAHPANLGFGYLVDYVTLASTSRWDDDGGRDDGGRDRHPRHKPQDD